MQRQGALPSLRGEAPRGRAAPRARRACPAPVHRLQHLLGNRSLQRLLRDGRPLPDTLRARLESGLGADLRGVRLHTGGVAAETPPLLGAPAYTAGADTVFARGQLAPERPEGRALLEHELAHVRDRTPGAPRDVVQRGVPWVDAFERRELDPAAIPGGLHYELIDHKLTAHTRRAADLDHVVTLVTTLNLYYEIAVDRADLKAKLLAARAGAADGKRVEIDVTPFLPGGLRRYLERLEAHAAAWRAYVAEKGQPDDIFRRYEARITAAASDAERARLRAEQEKEVRAYYADGPGFSDERASACHNLLLLATSGAPEGTLPGAYTGKAYGVPLDMDLGPVRASLLASIRGKGPFRAVPSADVEVGDLAVFRAGRPVPVETRIVHSAVVIRVSGGEVELLEKRNDFAPMATRTVRAVLDFYKKEKVRVHYLAPALATLTAGSGKGHGRAPPAEPFEVAEGVISPERSHVLFGHDSLDLLAHEDRKLLELFATLRGPARVRVHGYASAEGKAGYNLNLSAHRAVVVKKALAARLPSSSTLEAVAHGEVTHFGGRSQNRRVGIEVLGKPAPSAAPGGREPEP